MATVKRSFSGNFRGLDARPDRVDFRDREYRPPLRSLPPEYPAEHLISTYLDDYLADGMVLDQGSEGACTGFGLAAVINYIFWEMYQRKKLKGHEVPAPELVSPRMLYNNARLYDEWDGEDYDGSSCRGALKGWHKHGVCTAELFPYDDKTFIPPKEGWDRDAIQRPLGAYYRVNALSIVDMQAAIHETHAVYASAKVHKGWGLDAVNTIDTAVIRQDSRKVSGGHAFAIVGYNRFGFIVQNSWGGGWGYKGFGLLPYDDWVRNGYDAWVAAIGAPVATSEMPGSKAEVPLVVQSGLANKLAESASATSSVAQVADWSETLAYRHAVVSGNEGRLLRRLPEAADAGHNLEIVFEQAARRIADDGCRHLVFYAHGGITDERAAIRHVQKLGPSFAANGIHPVFFVWKTGLLESLLHVAKDQFADLRDALEDMRSKGLVDDLIDSFREKRDRTFELAARQLVGRTVWSEIKQNAEAAAVGDGTIRRISKHVRALLKKHGDLNVHFVGHSAGSIWLGHMAEDFRQARLADPASPPVKTVTLWAPACTVAFANRQYGKAFERGVITTGGMHIDLLDDERERADHVGHEGLYGKSILYLVSRALESAHKTPLLGLHLAWPDQFEAAYDDDVFAGASLSDVTDWASISKSAKVSLNVLSSAEANNGVARILVSHSSFDNDIEINTAMLTRILGAKPKVAIRRLDSN